MSRCTGYKSSSECGAYVVAVVAVEVIQGREDAQLFQFSVLKTIRIRDRSMAQCRSTKRTVTFEMTTGRQRTLFSNGHLVGHQVAESI